MDTAAAPRFRTGPLAPLGMWVTGHRRLVTAGWVLAVIGLGAFAPTVKGEKSGDNREAMVGALAHSGRVIYAAAGVMVAAFFTLRSPGLFRPRGWASSSASRPPWTPSWFD